MKKRLSKWLSLLLVTAMLVQILPASIFATESTDEYLNTLAEERPETAEEALDSAQILFEEESLREESVKHFRLDDGTYIAVQYGTPVHYEDDGEWVDYDNTLKAVNSLDGSGVSCYRVTNGDSIRVFAADAEAEVLLAVQKGEYGLAFAPAQEADAELPIHPNEPIVANEMAEEIATVLDFASAGEVSDDPLLAQAQSDTFYSALEYENAINGATLRYENYGNTIKESIVISAPQSEYVYSFDIETDDLTAALQEDGSVSFTAADGTLVYYIPAPYMIDANNEYSYDASYAITGSGNKYTLTVTADAAWLNDEARAYPVLLDPTIVEDNLGDDRVSATYINSGYPSGTASDSGLYVGDNGNENRMIHTLVHVNELTEIPDGSEVIYASFSLTQIAYVRKSNGATSLDVGLYPMHSLNGNTFYDIETSRWQNLMNVLTWNNVYGTTAYYKMAENPILTDVTTVSTATTGTGVSWDITLLAKKWYESNGNNLGFILKPTADEVTSRVAFHGPESTSGRPQLIVAYRNKIGINAQHTYQEAAIGRAGTAYISDSTLNQTTGVALLASSSNVMPFSLALYYNSIYGNREFTYDSKMLHTKSFANMKLGIGWKLSAQQTVYSVEIDDEIYLVYTDADGSEHYFYDAGYTNGLKTYKDEDGLGLKITVSGTNYTMTDDYGNGKFFGNGYLKEQYDAYGNYIYYRYNASAQLYQITRKNKGCTEEEILATLAYLDNRLISVTDEASRVIEMSYEDNRLKSIKYADGAIMQYNYVPCEDGAYRMATAYDSEAGYGIEFGYAADGTVDFFAEYVGTSKTYGRKFSAEKLSHNQTTYRDYGDDGIANSADDILTHMVLDTVGRTINTYSTDNSREHVLGVGLANYTSNSGTSKQNNRLTASAAAGQQGINLLDNASIENGSSNVAEARSWISDATSACMLSSTAYLGELSLLLWRTAASSTPNCWKQAVTLEAESSYTFSGYVHVPDNVTFSSGGGVYLALIDSDGEVLAQSEKVNYHTESTADGWIRLSATAEVEETCTAYACFYATNFVGSVYADAFQLEEEDSAATFNIVEDGSFEHTDEIDESSSNYWYKTGTAAITADVDTYFGDKTIVLAASDSHQRISRSVPVNVPLSSTFILSAWAKANADPDSNGTQVESGDLNPYFGLILRFYYSDNTSEVHYYPFDPYYHDWQYMQGIAVPEKTGDVTIDSITIVVAYDRNINTAYVDNVAFRMEPVQTYAYNSDGHLTATAQTGSGSESAQYDGADLTQYTSANQNKYTYTYNDQHDVLTATAGGVTATNTYNNAGNAIGSTLKNSGNTLSITTSATVTSDFNHTKTSTDENGSTTTYTYNASTEQLTSVKNAKNVTTQYEYNAAGRITKTSQNDVEINYIYNKGLLRTLGRTTKGSTGSTVYQGYTFEANAWGQTTTIGIANSANGSTWTKSFDLVTYTYEDYATNTEGSGGGNLKQMKYGNNDTVDYSYDKFDRLISMVYNSGKYVTYTYNSEGDLAEMKYGKNDTVLGVYRFEYDSLGRLIRSNEADGAGNLIQRTEHIYDHCGRLKSQSWIVGTTTFAESYTYSDGANGNGSLSQMTTATGATIAYAYDTLQRLNRKTVTYGGTTIYTNSNSFHTNGSSTTMQIEYHNVRDADGEVITGARYEYDALGNITKIYESEIAEGETARRLLAEYEYDDQNQLISETIRTYGTTPTTTTYTYTYDTAGNLITEEKNDVVTKTYSYSTGAWKDRLDSINGYAISYDTIGNPEVYRNGTVDSWDDPVTYYMDWENGRQLTYLEVWGDWQQRITYDYDADGIRTNKNVEGVAHSYITQNGKVVRETIGSGTTAKVLDFIYDESGKPFALIYTNGTAEPVTYYYVLNLQGDVVKLVEHVYDDDTDTYSLSTVASYTYTAWGEILTSSGTMASINPLRYRGYYYDAETGFYYLQSRYYDPVLHRFINADSYASTGTGILGYNMFAYCGNNPIRNIDFSGYLHIENHPIITSEGDENGFSIAMSEDFLDPYYCLYFSYEVVYHYGNGETYYGMGAERIAKEIFAHAFLYYYGKSLHSSLGEYLVVHGESIYVNRNESKKLKALYTGLWKYHTSSIGKAIVWQSFLQPRRSRGPVKAMVR